jgi:hypothetical protein
MENRRSMYTRTQEQMAESQYIVDVTNCRIEQRFVDGSVVITSLGSGAGKSVSPLFLAALRRK